MSGDVHVRFCESECATKLHWRWRDRLSAAAIQEEAANHRKVRRSRAEVLSVAEKGADECVRCGPRRLTQVNR
jgi:hypothetical protein